MANWCSWTNTQGYTAYNGYWIVPIAGSGVYAPKSIYKLAQAGATTTPFVFDADAYGIVCTAFPSAGGSGDDLIGIASRVSALETANVNLQNQVTALSSGSVTQAPNPEIIQAMAVIFGASMAAAAAIYGLKAIYNLFRTRYASE